MQLYAWHTISVCVIMNSFQYLNLDSAYLHFSRERCAKIEASCKDEGATLGYTQSNSCCLSWMILFLRKSAEIWQKHTEDSIVAFFIKTMIGNSEPDDYVSHETWQTLAQIDVWPIWHTKSFPLPDHTDWPRPSRKGELSILLQTCLELILWVIYHTS